MRSAKSHLDLTSEVIDEAKVTTTPTSAPANSKKHFSERPWIELEKLWRSKAKDPPPDIESLIRNDNNKQAGGSGGGSSGLSGLSAENGNGTLRKARPTSEQSHSKGYWPPPAATQVTSNPEAVKKVVDFLNPMVLDSYRHSNAIKAESNEHFTDLRSSW